MGSCVAVLMTHYDVYHHVISMYSIPKENRPVEELQWEIFLAKQGLPHRSAMAKQIES